MRALVIGDSLAIPRPKRGQHLSATWPALLKEKFPDIDVWQRCRPGVLCYEVLREFNLFTESLDAFDFLVIQVGIGDCCPRPYPHVVYRVLQALHWENVIKKINSWYPFLLRFRAVPWFTPQKYFDHIDEIATVALQQNPHISVSLIAIGEPSRELLRKVPGIEKWVPRYNTQLERIADKHGARVSFINPYAGTPLSEVFLEDGHHLTVKGHQLVAAAVADTWNFSKRNG